MLILGHVVVAEIQDFPDRGCQPRGVAPTYYFGHFSWKLHDIENVLDREARILAHPWITHWCGILPVWLTREDVEDPGALMVGEVLDWIVRSCEVTAGGRELLETHRLWKKNMNFALQIHFR